MKRFTTTNLFSACLMLAIAFLFTSCMDDMSVKETELKQDDSASLIYGKVINAESVEARNLVFQSLEPAERADFWLQHTDRLIKLNNFSAEQMAFMEQTKAFLKTDLSSEKASDYFTSTPETIFSQQELTEMFASPMFFGENTTTTTSGLVIAIGCSCSANWHCRLAGGVCDENAGCTASSWGCGFLGLEVCTGWCVGIARI